MVWQFHVYFFSFGSFYQFQRISWKLYFFPYPICTLFNAFHIFFYAYHSKEAKMCGVSQQKPSPWCFKNNKKGFLEFSKWKFSLFCCICGSFEQYVRGKIYGMQFPCFKSLKRQELWCWLPPPIPPSNHWDWRTLDYGPGHKNLCCPQAPAMTWYNEILKGTSNS